MSKPPKNVSIVGSYSLDNRGDELLLKGTIKLFQVIFGKETNFSIFVADAHLDAAKFEKNNKLRFFNNILGTEALKNKLSITSEIMVFLYLLLLSYLYKYSKIKTILRIAPRQKRRQVFEIINSDLVVYRSIDQVSDVFGLPNFLKVYLQCELYSNLCGSRFLLHAHSIYFTKYRKLGNYLIRRLSRKTRITLRDEISISYFNKHRIRNWGFIPPPTLLITKEFNNRLIYPKSKKLNLLKILVVPRVSLSSKDNVIMYVDVIKALVVSFPRCEVSLMGQSFVSKYKDDDQLNIQRIYNSLDRNTQKMVKIVNVKSTELSEILSIFSKNHLVISERAFSIVTALSLGKPAIGIDPYGGKNLGLMKAFHQGSFCLSVKKANSESVLKLVEEVVLNYEVITENLDARVVLLENLLLVNTQRLVMKN